jgi:hypothetical protein
MKRLSFVLVLTALLWASRGVAAETPHTALAKRDYADTLRYIVLLQKRARFMEATAQKMAVKANELEVDAAKAKARASKIKRAVGALKKRAVHMKRHIVKHGVKTRKPLAAKKAEPFVAKAATRPSTRDSIHKGLAMESRRDEAAAR